MDIIPIVVFHIGDQQYFQRCVVINSTRNPVYVIGDDSNKNLFTGNPNVTFIHMNKLYSEELEDFKHHYVNYEFSTNPTVVFLWFARVFFLKQFILKYRFDYVSHIDSDCIILENLNTIFNRRKTISFALQEGEQFKNKYHMVGSIHSGLLNLEFCNKFIELCFDIYKTKTKFHLIEPKVRWHEKVNAGGICDMTLYYLLYSEKLLSNIFDLNDLIYIDNEPCVFDHQISSDYGYLGWDTFKKEGNIKAILKKEDKWYFETKQYKDKIRALSIHYQGGDKAILERLTVADWSPKLSMNYSLADFVTGERLQELCDVYCGAELANIKNPRTLADTTKHINLTTLNSSWNNPKIVYCYGDALPVLCKKVQFFTNPFVLVAHNSDINITDVFSELLNNKKILAMYSQNVCYNHPKLNCLPIGLANSQWEQGDLMRIYNAMMAKSLKTNDVYFQFNTGTNISRNTCKSELEKKGLVFMSPTPFTDYINILASYKFAVCPEGNGIDSHRMWECYYMDVIPIVLSTVFTKKIREMLPCILLDSWSDFNLTSCLTQYDTLVRELHSKRKYLQLSYYNELIRSSII